MLERVAVAEPQLVRAGLTATLSSVLQRAANVTFAVYVREDGDTDFECHGNKASQEPSVLQLSVPAGSTHRPQRFTSCITSDDASHRGHSRSRDWNRFK